MMTWHEQNAEAIEERKLFRSLIRQAAARPGARANVLADSQHECTYSEIPELLEGIQSFLSANSVRFDECVAIELTNSLRAALGLLALLDAGVSLFAMPAPGHGARTRAPGVENAKFCRWILSTNVDAPKHALNETPPSELFELRRNPDFDESAAVSDGREPRLFFRTSGSLGTSKIVMHRYGNFYRNAVDVRDLRRFGSGHRIALPMPIFHTFGLGSGFLAGIAGGSAIDFQERGNVLRYLERESDFAPNVAYLTPSLCEMLVRSRRSSRPYELIVTGGDRIGEATFKRSEELHGGMVVQYGCAELGVVATSTTDMPLSTRCRTVGEPVHSAEIRVIEVEGAPADSNRGELQVRRAPGYGFEGYVDLRGRSISVNDTFDGEWYRTKDLAEINRDGSLAILGRCDLSVNRSGVLLPLADVECRMRELDGVEDVAVVASEQDNLRGSALIAFCVASRDCQATGAELRSRFALGAPPFAVPDSVRIISELPKLPNGKFDRVALAAMAERLATSDSRSSDTSNCPGRKP